MKYYIWPKSSINAVYYLDNYDRDLYVYDKGQWFIVPFSDQVRISNIMLEINIRLALKLIRLNFP